jgi:hypothetical protein
MCHDLRPNANEPEKTITAWRGLSYITARLWGHFAFLAVIQTNIP